MAWTYEQSTGRLYDPDMNIVATGYSGKSLGLNNPSLQAEKDTGPIVAGEYLIGDLVRSHDTLGTNVLPLIPNPANQMFGRSGFFLHGDNPAMNHSASDGCIVLPLWVRMQVSDSDDRQLVVVP